MPTEIDSLSISIEAKAQKANSSIDKLVSRLDVLSNSLGKLHNGSNNLVALGRGVESLSRGMQGFKGVGEAKFIRLANGINQLANINTQGLNNAASSLSHMTRAFNNIGAVSQNAVQVADLAKNLGKLGNKSVTNAITNIPQLATAMNNLMTTLSKAPTVSENVIRMTNALANLSAQGAKVGSASNSISKGLNRASNSATRASKSFGGLASAFGKFYATYFLAIRGFKGLGNAIDSTADYLEAYNYFNVALGKIGSDWSHQFEQYGYDSAEAYADSFSTRLQQRLSGLSGLSIQLDADGNGLLSETGLQNLGLNIKEVTQYASQLSSVTNSIGQTGEVSLATASSITKLGSDLSSLFNLDYADVMQNLQSGLIGQSRALYKYGIDITNATLQTYAYELGLEKAVSEMTQAEKMQLRILAILDQSKVAWGDLANTINSPSNMMRQFSNNVKEVGMVLGQLFIPLLQKVMPIINGVTIAIKRLLVSIASLLGINLDLSSFGQGFSGIEEDIDGIGDSFDDATASAKKFNTYTLGIDELNIQPEQAESGGSGAGGVGGGIDLTDEILEATSEYEKVWQEAFDNMQNRAQEFADKIEKFFAPITDPLKKLFEDISIGDWFSAGQDTSNLVSGIFDLFSNSIEKVDWEQIGKNIGEYLKGINWTSIFSSAGNFIETLWDSAWELWKGSFKIAPMGTLIGSLLAGYFITHGIHINPKIIVAGVTWEIGFRVGKELGKKLFPDDAVFYDNFKWFGDGGFFDTVFGDINSVGDAIKRMGQIWTATNNAIMESPVLSVLQFIASPVNFVIRWSIYNAQGFDFKELKSNISSIISDLQYIGNSFETLPFIKALTGFANSSYISDIVGSLDVLKERFSTWYTQDVAVWFTEDKWIELWNNIQNTFDEKWNEISEQWKYNIVSWWNNDVSPWFTKERWNLLFGIIKKTLQAKWIEVMLWWNTLGIVKWYNEYVKPWFAKEKWSFDGIRQGLTRAFNNAISSIKTIWNSFANWLNNALKLDFGGFQKTFNVLGEEIKIDLPGFQLELGRIPTFQTGGFPEDGLFMANRNELVGRFSNGRTAVANNEMIVEGIEGGVERAVARVLVPYLADIAQNTRETADKDMSVNIGDRDIARANARGSKSLGYALIY